jgi:crossover junction endodeoxyribonuclease RuvC
VNVLALDVSLTRTGWASAPDRCGVIDTGKLRGVERLAVLADTVREYAQRADLVVIEGYAFASRNSQAHALGEAGGVVRLELHRLSVPVVEVPPKVLKVYAAGVGNASKEQVLVQAVKRLGYEGSDNNEADALWLWALAVDAYGHPSVAVPKTHRRALPSVRWPKVAA